MKKRFKRLFRIKIFNYDIDLMVDLESIDLCCCHAQWGKESHDSLFIGPLKIFVITLSNIIRPFYVWFWSLSKGKEILKDERNNIK